MLGEHRDRPGFDGLRIGLGPQCIAESQEERLLLLAFLPRSVMSWKTMAA
jgi:hypothetical protein